MWNHAKKPPIFGTNNAEAKLPFLPRLEHTSSPTRPTTMASHDKPSAEVAEHHEASIPDAPSKDLASDAAAKGQGITGYETLGVWKTVMAFKMNSLICFLVTFSAATDGYQIAYLVHLSDHGTAANLVG